LFNYDEKNNTLIVSRVKQDAVYFNEDGRRIEVEGDLIRKQRKNYNDFIRNLPEDIAFIADRILEQWGSKYFSDMKYGVMMEDGVTIKPKITVKDPHYRENAKHYSIEGAFWGVRKDNGETVKVSETFELLKIPYMSDIGVFTFPNGTKRVIPARLRSQNSVFVKTNKSTEIPVSVTIVAPKWEQTYSIRLTDSDRMGVILGKDSSVLEVIMKELALLPQEHNQPVNHYFKNASSIFRTQGNLVADSLSEILKESELTQNKQRMVRSRGIGKLRSEINRICSIYPRVENRVLYEDLYLPVDGTTLKKDTFISRAIVARLRKNGVTSARVWANPRVHGKLKYPVVIRKVEKGTKLNSLLREKIEGYSGYQFAPFDYEGEPVVVPAETVVTHELSELFYLCKVESVTVSLKGKKYEEVFFCEDIIGNGTVLAMDLFSTATSKDEWVDIQNVTNPWLKSPEELRPSEMLTVFDRIAIVSLLVSYYLNSPGIEAYNRDTTFLKKIVLCGDLLSEAIRSTLPEYELYKFNNSMIKSFNKLATVMGEDIALLEGKKFYFIKKFFESKLSKASEGAPLCELVNSVNPIATITHVNQVVVETGKKASDSQRLLELLSYGRVCPYDTSQGGMLGLRNSLSVASRVDEDGYLLTPYYRVEGGRIDTSSVVWESPLSEYKSREIFGSRVDFENGKKKILSRVPGLGRGVEGMLIENVDRERVTRVNALSEQHCGPGAMFIPFACNDDAARVTFGISLLRQSLYVLESEAPRITTKLYSQLLKYSKEYCIIAEKDGIVTNVSQNSITVLYDGEREDVVHSIKEVNISGSDIFIARFRKRNNERFREGEILADTHVSKEGTFTPGVNVLCAIIPSAGYNYEDAIDISEQCARKFTSIERVQVKQKVIDKKRILSRVDVSSENLFRKKGEVIADIKSRMPEETEFSITGKTIKATISGFVTDVEYPCRENDNVCSISMLSFKNLAPGDKMSGRHGNKGVVSRLRKTSTMPVFNNGVSVDICLNPCGIVSRMNIGQELEGYCGFIAYLLGISIESNPFNGASLEEVKLLMQFVYDFANYNDVDSASRKWLSVPGFPKELVSIARDRYSTLQEWKGSFNPDGTAELYDPVTGEYFINPVTFGMPYFLKINQEGDHKLHARAGMWDSDYEVQYYQPPQGAANQGGQKIGNDEAMTILAHGAARLSEEFRNEKSDNYERRVDLTLDSIGHSKVYGSRGGLRSTDIFRYYLEMMGISVRYDRNELRDISRQAVLSKKHYLPSKIILGESRKEKEETYLSMSTSSIENLVSDIRSLLGKEA
jgi:DNA-directed RNA polymerase beta subunit